MNKFRRVACCIITEKKIVKKTRHMETILTMNEKRKKNEQTFIFVAFVFVNLTIRLIDSIDSIKAFSKINAFLVIMHTARVPRKNAVTIFFFSFFMLLSSLFVKNVKQNNNRQSKGVPRSHKYIYIYTVQKNDIQFFFCNRK